MTARLPSNARAEPFATQSRHASLLCDASYVKQQFVQNRILAAQIHQCLAVLCSTGE
jgi:hypothetical protein